jgi:hypothetical protein
VGEVVEWIVDLTSAGISDAWRLSDRMGPEGATRTSEVNRSAELFVRARD